MEVKITSYNVITEMLEISTVPTGKNPELVERIVSKDALSILLEKVAKKDLPSNVSEIDKAILEAIYKSGGMAWVEQQINEMQLY